MWEFVWGVLGCGGGGQKGGGGGATVSAAFNILFPIVVTLFVLLIIDQSDIYCRVR
jgi:hypothetical protein